MPVEIRSVALAFCAQGHENRRVLGLNEPQVWTLIGVFAAAMVGVLGLVYASIRNLADGLRNEMTSIRNEMASMRNELIARMDSRFDHLDRDVAFLMRKEFGD